MMLFVFVAMFIALTLSFFRRSRASVALLLVCFVLAVGLFLYEVYSPEYGFRMPWIQTELKPEQPLISNSAG